MSDSDGSEVDVEEVMEKEEMTALGMIDRNMIAHCRANFGPFAQIDDVDDVLDYFGVERGTARKLLTALTSVEEVAVDACTLQAVFHSLYPSSVYDRHALFLRGMSSSR